MNTDNIYENEPTTDKIKVLVVEPERKPYKKEIYTDLHTLQKEVGGFIEAVYPFDDNVALICDDEGKLKGSPLNRALKDERGEIYDVIAGTFLIAGLGAEDFASLSDDLISKYYERFKTPELFINLNGRLLVIPMNEEKQKETKKTSVVSKLNELKYQNISPKKVSPKGESR